MYPSNLKFRGTKKANFTLGLKGAKLKKNELHLWTTQLHFERLNLKFRRHKTTNLITKPWEQNGRGELKFKVINSGMSVDNQSNNLQTHKP